MRGTRGRRGVNKGRGGGMEVGKLRVKKKDGV